MSIEQKKPLAVSLTQFAQGQISDLGQLLGKSLPCHVVAVAGAIVTVNFDVSAGLATLPPVTCAIAESRYVRLPVRVGDKGVVVSCDARLGGITGLGAGIAELTDAPGNLAASVFVPVGNAAWDTLDPDAVVLSAPNGAIIRTDDGASIVTISAGSVSLVHGGASVTLAGGNVSINGVLLINDAPYLGHKHTDVMPGSSNSGGVA